MLHFIFCFSINDVRGWGWEIGAMCHGFMIRGQQTCVEDIMDALLLPLGWKCQLIDHR